MTRHSLVRQAAADQRGMALMVSLVLLVMITILALTAVRFSTVSLRASVNDELRVDAFERTQSLIDATIQTGTNFDLTLATDATVCVTGMSGCTNYSLSIPSSFTADIPTKQKVKVRRIEPLQGPMPRGVGESSAQIIMGSYFQVEAEYDETADGRGRAEIIEGIGVPTLSGL